MRIVIDYIPHNEQRYNTCGDWQFDSEGNLNIKVSIMEDTGIEGSHCVAVHELVEALLCKARGITQEQVDKFDMNFDASCKEPGDDPRSPYCGEHNIASGIERMVHAAFGLFWKEYEVELQEMYDDYEETHKNETTP